MSERKRPGLTAAAAALLPALLALLCRFTALQGAAEALAGIADAPGAFLAEWLIFAAVMLAAWGVTGRAYAAWLAGLFPLILTLVDYHKRMINGLPLDLSEFALARQFDEIVRFALPQLRVTLWTALPPLLYAAVLALLIVGRDALRFTGRARHVCALCGACACALLFLSPLGTDVSAASAGDPDAERDAPLRLFRAYRLSREPAEEPDYDAWEAPGPAGPPAPEETEPDTPTVIFLMSESFFDFTKLPHLTFDEDPLERFHELERGAVHGTFLSNTYAGGTARVEMEVLTGLCNHLTRESDNLCTLSAEAYARMPSLADVFGGYGYERVFLHSYSDALYNRRTIYSALGFDALCFEQDFPADAERKGGHLSDMALSQKIVSLYEGERPGPLMVFAVSMENHQPYKAGRFDGEEELAIRSDVLGEEDLAVLKDYAYGARDAAEALGCLTDYFSAVDEKVMIVFWGDHKPNLTGSDGKTLYRRLGYSPAVKMAEWSETELRDILTTDYLIWTNYGQEPEERVESSTMLGLHVLQRLGLRLNGCFSWLAENIEPFYLMYRPRLFVDSAGYCYGEIPAEHAEAMERYRDAVWDVAYGGGKLFGIDRGTDAP